MQEKNSAASDGLIRQRCHAKDRRHRLEDWRVNTENGAPNRHLLSGSRGHLKGRLAKQATWFDSSPRKPSAFDAEDTARRLQALRLRRDLSVH